MSAALDSLVLSECRTSSERVVTISAKPKVERMGVSALDYTVSSWGWAYRSQEIEDYGIDGHIEPFDETDRPSGQLIAVQVKAGPSYFEEANGGWYFRADQVRGRGKEKREDKHLQYWLSHVLPVIIVMYEPTSKSLYWQLVAEENIEFTERAWKILIPKGQVLGATAMAQLREFAKSVPSAANDPLTASLPLLPPSAAVTLAAAAETAPAGAMRLARMLAEGRFQPELTVETALAAKPSWLLAGQGHFEAAIGAFANDHGFPDLARRAFVRAAEYGGPGEPRLRAIAALLSLAHSDISSAEEQFSRVEAEGDGGLFFQVVHAALTDLRAANANMPTLRATLEGVAPQELESESTLMVYLGTFAAQRLQFDEALEWFDGALKVRSAMTGALLGKAETLISKIGNGKAVVAARDRAQARQLAATALADMRRWAGPSERALVVLLTTHMMIGGFGAAVVLATPRTLGGDALEREAVYGPVAIIGAQAALALGDRTRAEGFATLVAGTDAADVIRPLRLDPALSDEDKAAAWRAALAASMEPAAQRRAIYQLAALGQLTSSDLDLAHVAPNFDTAHRDVLLARDAAARGRVQQAVLALRRYTAASPAAAEILIEVLTKADQIDDALAECDRSITRFGPDKIAHDKLNLLVKAGRIAEAHAFAATLLAGQDLDPEQRITLRRRLIGHSARSNDWATAEQHCRDACVAHPDQSEFAWNLIAAQANQGRFEAAWATLRELRPSLDNGEYVPLWIDLHGRFGFTESDVETALDLATRWPATGSAVFGALLESAGRPRPDGQAVLPSIRDDLRDRFQRELDLYVARGTGDEPGITTVSPAEFLEIARTRLVPEAGRLDQAATLVRAGQMPLGALAAAAQRPYAQMLVERSCGALFASTADQAQFALECAAARAAVNRTVIIEASAIHVATVIPGRWESLRAAFAEVRLPRPALADVDAARREIVRASGTAYSVGFDAAADALVLSETDPVDHQRQIGETISLDRAARELFVSDLPDGRDLPAAHAPWLAPIELALREGLPLWSDDVALRSIAQGQEVAAFGTVALIITLIEDELIEDSLAEDLRNLARAGVVVDLTHR